MSNIRDVRTLTFVIKEYTIFVQKKKKKEYTIRKFGTRCFGFLDTEE